MVKVFATRYHKTRKAAQKAITSGRSDKRTGIVIGNSGTKTLYMTSYLTNLKKGEYGRRRKS